MTVYHNRVRPMERATILSMSTDVTVWHVSMEQIVITVYNFYFEECLIHTRRLHIA